MTSSSPDSPRCPECGAASPFRSDRCWLCGAPLGDGGGQGSTPPQLIEATSKTFSLTSLFLVMTLVAVGAGVFAAAPGLGILFAIVATPALIRTVVISAKQKSRGRAASPGQKVAAFLGSIGVVLLVLLSIGVALLTACLTACAGFLLDPKDGRLMTVGIVVGGVAGLGLAGWLLWLIWRWQRKG
jgi:hypothetical protein